MTVAFNALCLRGLRLQTLLNNQLQWLDKTSFVGSNIHGNGKPLSMVSTLPI
jgi:hypothetical protein